MALIIATLMTLEEIHTIVEDDPWRYLSTYKTQTVDASTQKRHVQKSHLAAGKY